MAGSGHHNAEQTEQELLAIVGEKEQRKLQARRQRDGIWFGLGMFGLIGWSVAVPVLLCVALGLWIDRRWPGPYSWTLMLLFIGFGLGCANAWYWVMRERQQIEQTTIHSEATDELEDEMGDEMGENRGD
jgi:ATP synthase protein I